MSRATLERMAKFDPFFYQQYRPLYPAELFAELPRVLRSRGFNDPFEIADIGCGTGHSTLSILRAGVPARVVGVDPDPAMLERARELPELQGAPARFQEGSGESTGLAASGVDAITVGSAFHWMDPERATEEFLRILRPRGVVWVFEYQFPKCPSEPELNEWIRREFNLRWKAPGQVPRGDFKNVTRCFRKDARLEPISDRRVPMNLPLDAAVLAGMILSQSRVLHYENTLTDEEREIFRKQVGEKVREFLGDEAPEFEFNLQLAAFGRR